MISTTPSRHTSRLPTWTSKCYVLFFEQVVWLIICEFWRSRVCLSRSDPSVSLNYSIFLYNNGERKLAGRQFSNYEKRMDVLRHSKGSDIDQEVRRGEGWGVFLRIISMMSLRHFSLGPYLPWHSAKKQNINSKYKWQNVYRYQNYKKENPCFIT